MRLTKTLVHAGWLCVAIGLAFFPSGGIDTNLLVGWAFVVWTFLFSVAWSFYLYDIALQYMSKPIAQPVGSTLVIACAYVFWFVLVPYVLTKARRAGNPPPLGTDVGRGPPRSSS